ncbi:hypothetical protein D3C72_1252240 [compost metagenome]
MIGNGGDAVVCVGQDGRKQVEILDYYEARVMRGIQVDLGAESLSVEDKIDLALARLSKISPIRARAYKAEAQVFIESAKPITGSVFEDIPDSQHLTVPANCTLSQLVIQRHDAPADEPKYLYDADSWKLMSNTQKAGMILHEVVYSEALDEGAWNSIGSRYLNSKISSSLAAYKTDKNIVSLLREVGLNKVEIAGMLMKDFNRDRIEQYFKFHSNGVLAQGILADNTAITVGRNKFVAKDIVEFHPNGVLKVADLVQPTTITVKNRSFSNVGGRPYWKHDLEFYADGNISQILLQERQIENFQVQGKTIKCQEAIGFHPNGNLRNCVPDDSFSGQSTYGYKVRCAPKYGGGIDFNEQGLIDMRGRDSRDNCTKSIF